MAWSRGYPDGDRLPPRALAAAVPEIARVLSVPLSVDVEGGYSADPRAVGETVAAVVDAGAVGINLEDGAGPPELLCAKIEAAKTSAATAGVDLFVNARTDVYLRGLAGRCGRAGGDHRARPALSRRRLRWRLRPRAGRPRGDPAVASGLGDLPLNVMVYPGLPPVAALGALGVRRVSAGSAIAQVAYGAARGAIEQILATGATSARSTRRASDTAR